MPKFSQNSLAKLETCDTRIIHLFSEVIQHWDCTILDGFRNEFEQERYFKEGKSKVKFPHSLHNRTPSLAIDVAPYPIDWNDLKRFYHFGGFVRGIATQMGIPLTWGGDWDNDFKLDQKFNDLVHFEIQILEDMPKFKQALKQVPLKNTSNI